MCSQANSGLIAPPTTWTETIRKGALSDGFQGRRDWFVSLFGARCTRRLVGVRCLKLQTGKCMVRRGVWIAVPGYKAIPCASLLSREAVSTERDSLI